MTKAFILLPILMLAACDSSPDVSLENASVGEVANEMRKQGKDGFVNPGKWQQIVTLVDIEAPGMPAEMKNAMSQAAGQKQVHEVCLTEAQAKSPKEDFFTGADKNCRYRHFNWGNGKIDLMLDCKHPQATQTMALTGGYQPDNYSLAMTVTSDGAGPAEHMVMKMKVDAKRIGACAPGDEKKG